MMWIVAIALLALVCLLQRPIFTRIRRAAVAAALLLSAPLLAGAQTTEITNGLTWLNAQVQSDGSLSSESTSVASPYQSRTEAAFTLANMSSVPAALGQAIALGDDGTAESLAREAMVAGALRVNASSELLDLLASQNEDGGFGGAPGYRSNALDTALALLALKHQLDYGFKSDQVGRALTYLAQAQAADGAWGVKNQSQTYVTSWALLAVQSWHAQFPVGATTLAARNWLLAALSGGSFGDPLEDAVGLLALSTQTADATLLQPLASAMVASQSADGSWGGDPFVTALALRSLWTFGNPPPVSTTAGVTGVLVDATSGAPVAGALVGLVEAPGVSAESRSDGTFSLSGVGAGSYTFTVAKLGFEGVSAGVTLTSGQITNVGRIGLNPAVLTATVTGTVRNQAGSGLQGAVVAVGTSSAITDAQGHYILSGIAPTIGSITATLKNYQQATSTVLSLAAGNIYAFSPTLYTGTAPGTSLGGQIVDAAAGSAISGAIVTVGNLTVQSGADGSFSFPSIDAGEFSIEVAASGFGAFSATGVLVSGVNNLGTITLDSAGVLATLSGRVLDAQTGEPIGGATVSIEGNTTVSAADGSYAIAGIASSQFDVIATAGGYFGLSQHVSLTVPGDATVDLALTPAQTLGIAIDAVTPSKALYLPSDMLRVAVDLRNTTDQPSDVIVDALVLDADSKVVLELKANTHGLGQNPPNLPFALPAAGTLTIPLEELLLRQPVGNYTVLVRAYDALGRAIAEAQAGFAIDSLAMLGGGIAVDPPLSQTGTETPITFSGQLSNLGNEPIPAGEYELSIVADNPDAQGATRPQTEARMLASDAALKHLRGMARDGEGNLYVVSSTFNDGRVFRIAPDGSMAVAAQIPATPPHFPRLSDVAWDPAGNLWVSSSASGVVWRIDPNGAISTIPIESLSRVAGIEVGAQGHLLLTGDRGGEYRLVSREADGSESVLWANGLSSPMALVRDGAGSLVVSNNFDGTLVKVLASGEIEPFVSGLNRPMGITIDAVGNFYVASNTDGSVVKVSTAGVKTVYSTGLPQPVDLRFDRDGNLFVTCQGDNTIRKIAPDGSHSIFSRGIASRPRAMKYDSAGNLFITNDDGTVRKLDTSGQLTVLATGLTTPWGLTLDATQSSVLVTNYNAGTVSRVAGNGTTTLISGLHLPWGIAAGGNGDLLVAEYGKGQLVRFDANGSALGTVESLFSFPSQTVIDPDGNIVVSNSGLATIVESDVPRIFFREFRPRLMTPDPLGGAIYAIKGGYDVYRIDYLGNATLVKTLPFYAYGIAVDGAGRLVFSDNSGRKLYRMDGAGDLTVLANTVGSPRFLAGDNAGNVYVLFGDHSLGSVAADGTISILTRFYQAPTYDYPNGLGVAADGRPLVFTSNAKVIAVDPSSGDQVLIKSGIRANGLTIDAQDNLYAAFSSALEFVKYDPFGVELTRWAGFSSPQNVSWDGSQYWFMAGRKTYSLADTPGAYPVKRVDSGFGEMAFAPSGDIYSVVSGSVMRWDGSTFVQHASVPDARSLTAIAARGDGTFAVADLNTSRVVELASDFSVSREYAGLSGVRGLAFDDAGRLYVANNGSGTIARFAADAQANAVPSVFAAFSTPGWLDFDADGTLWVTRIGGVAQVDASGLVSHLPASTSVGGIRVGAAGAFIAATGSGQVQRWNGSAWQPFAAGFSSPEGVRQLPDGAIAVASRSNGTVVGLKDGVLAIRASGMTNPHNLDISADGLGLLVSGDQGRAYQVGADGSVQSLQVADLVGRANLYGIRAIDSSRFSLAGTNNALGSLFEITVTDPVQPPAPGTVVHRASVLVPEIDSVEASISADFGSWLPPYGGEFSVRIARSGLVGELSNTFHVGSLAQGVLSVGTSLLPAGTHSVPLQLHVSGADASAISRVETSLLKPTVIGIRPLGMSADRAGNIYATDSNSLRKTSPEGAETILASGYRFGKGMAIDDQERLYVPVGQQLLRFTTDGQQTVLVPDLGGTPAGVAVKRNGEIIVAVPGRLLQVSPDGAVATYSSAGVPQPEGIAIDGRDNVYVFNRNNLITQVKPDGSVVVLFDKADGVEHPKFEYEGVAMTADCGENLYIAPFVWERVDQAGEEYTLAQVNPRTGNAAVVLDGRRIHHDLTDMDYLVFDRFGSRILMWTDYSGGRIWQVPVTCGAIAVEAHLVTAPGQTLAGMNLAPGAVVPLANGGTEYVWSLRDVTSDGLAFGFDTKVENLALGETRPVLDSAYLLFENSFSPNKVKLPLAVPSVQADNLIDLAVSSDKPAYRAGESALLASQLANTRAVDVAGTLTVDILDAAGSVIGQSTSEGVFVAAGTSVDVPSNFSIGALAPATYLVRASLADDQQLLARATAELQVLSDAGSGLATSSLSLDKASYAPSALLTIDSMVTSTSANTTLGPLTLSLRVTDAAGAVVYSRQVGIEQLTAGSTKQLLNQYSVDGASAGTYTVTQTLLDASGDILDLQSATYQVESSADTGSGLAGMLTANPVEVAVGAPVSFGYSVRNQGNAELTALPLTVRVVDPATETEIASFTSTADLAVGGALVGNHSWVAQGHPGQVLVAVLSATVASGEIALAQSNVQLAQPVAPSIELSAIDTGGSRVLVLVTCRKGEALDIYSETDDTLAVEGLNCTDQRAAIIRRKLEELVIDHVVVSTGDEFETEMRCGAFDTFWISGGSHKLSPLALGELREAMGRGDGILVDGFHDAAKGSLDSVLGVAAKGQLNRSELLASVDPASGLPLGSFQSPGKAVSYWLEGGAVLASFDDSGAPAIVGHGDGLGRSVVFAFSVPDWLAQGYAAADSWPGELLRAAIERVHNAPRNPWPHEAAELGLALTNPADATAHVTAVATLPAGLQYLAAYPEPQAPAPDGDGTLRWSFPLAPGATRDVVVWVGAEAAGSYALPFAVSASDTAGGAGGQPSEISLLLEVDSSAGIAEDAATAIDLVAVSGGADAAAKDRAQQSATNAISASIGADPVRALIEWVEAGKALRDISSGDTGQALQAVSVAIQFEQRALCKRMRCVSGKLGVTHDGVAVDELDPGETALFSSHVSNTCQAPFQTLDLSARLISRTTGKAVVKLEEVRSLADVDGEIVRETDWLTPSQADELDGVFTLRWQGIRWHLDHLEIEIEPPLPQ